MAIAAINTAATVNYVSKLDPMYKEDGKHLPGATIWKLGAMTSFIEAEIAAVGTKYDFGNTNTEGMSEDDIAKNVNISIDVQAMSIEAVRLCLRGWDNYNDHAGNAVAFKTQKTSIKNKIYTVVHNDILEGIPKDVIIELYSEIQKIGVVTKEQRKNSVTG